MMAVDERSRRELHRRLKEAVDVESADLLLDHLPPPHLALATKADLERAINTLTWRMLGFLGVTFTAMFGGFAGLVATLH
jgi:hypothetical protein